MNKLNKLWKIGSVFIRLHLTDLYVKDTGKKKV